MYRERCYFAGNDGRVIWENNRVCKGKGGSLHIADLNAGNLGANGDCRGGIPIATGSGLTGKYKKTGKVTVCFFGDGASNTGAFHEAVDIWRLPEITGRFMYAKIIFYAMSTPVREAFPILDIVLNEVKLMECQV